MTIVFGGGSDDYAGVPAAFLIDIKNLNDQHGLLAPKDSG